MLIVMVAIGTSLVLTYSFLQTQTASLSISRNGMRRDLALQAAQTGAAVAVQTIQSPSWRGVSEPLSGTLMSDNAGTAAYGVEFLPVEATSNGPLADDSPLQVRIRSTGSWQSFDDKAERVERYVEVLVRLEPRVPGRVIRAGDSAAAVDVLANPGDYNAIQSYTLFAGNGSTSLTIDPQARIEGNTWLYNRVQLFQSPTWGTTARRQYLTDIGTQLVASSGGTTVFLHPHPLAGTVNFYNSQTGELRNDLTRTGIPYTMTSKRLTLPEVSFSNWRTYRLYEGGFEYKAVEIRSSLNKETLRPTPENPLGVFYCNGSLQIRDDVNIQGTLVVSGTLTFAGNRTSIAGFNWTGAAGSPLVSNQRHWQRLPAVIANNVAFDREAQVVIDGAVVARKSVTGAGGTFEHEQVGDVTITGTATAAATQQPWSVVQLAGKPDLKAVRDDGSHAVWLADGNSSGAWYRIVGIDRSNGRLTVHGEANVESPVSFRIGRNRRQYVDIRGPIAGETCAISHTNPWRSLLLSLLWSERYSTWTSENDTRKKNGLPPISFVDWLANPGNFSGWGYPYSSYGLALDPTFHARNTAGVSYRWSPPLFRPYIGTTKETEFAGYRWTVLSWRERQSLE